MEDGGSVLRPRVERARPLRPYADDSPATGHYAEVPRVSAASARRQQLDQDSGSAQRPLEVVVDGRFTNRVVLQQLPSNTVLIGRVRKDAKLYHLPAPPPAGVRGRGRLDGERAPTPQQLRCDEDVEWETVQAWAAGKVHGFRVKTLSPLRWRPAGGQRNLRLVVIAPLAYRPRPDAKRLYRQPAYLIVSDPDLSLQSIVQHYVRRWEIEVNFRDQKTLLGVGEAQVRHPRSVAEVPRMIVAAYSWLLLAARRAGQASPDALPPPKWQAGKKKQRATTQDLLQRLRAEPWGEGLRHFCSFASVLQQSFCKFVCFHEVLYFSAPFHSQSLSVLVCR